MADEHVNPAQESSDYAAMKPDWELIRVIRAGARTVKAAGQTYLPKYEEESLPAYERRLAYTPWRPVFVDALRGICAKPFDKKVQVNEAAPDDIQGKIADPKTKRREGGFVDDVDGQGNHLHVFARDTFVNGVANGLAAILVDFPTMAPNLTLADEREAGARPYWVQIPVIDIIDLRWTRLKGRVVPGHVRIKECVVEMDPLTFAETAKHRIRQFDLIGGQPMWKLWEMVADRKNGEPEWMVIGEGVITLPEIPIALFWTGERSFNYRVKPPLIDMAVMQMEIYRTFSRSEEILTYAGSPMLKATGMLPPEATQVIDETTGRPIDRPAPQITVGPKKILFAPPAMEGVQPDWDYIQPDASCMTEIRADKEARLKEFSELALQPMTPESGNITATAAAIDAAKSHSAVEAWANDLADTLNTALKFTLAWMKRSDTVSVDINTDFAATLQGADEARVILDGSKTSVVSKKTVREEWRRRGLLAPSHDEDEEEQRLAEEAEALEPEEGIDPVTGRPIPAMAGGNPPAADPAS